LKLGAECQGYPCGSHYNLASIRSWCLAASVCLLRLFDPAAGKFSFLNGEAGEQHSPSPGCESLSPWPRHSRAHLRVSRQFETVLFWTPLQISFGVRPRMKSESFRLYKIGQTLFFMASSIRHERNSPVRSWEKPYEIETNLAALYSCPDCCGAGVGR
jgi:hypothetical protein